MSEKKIYCPHCGLPFSMPADEPGRMFCTHKEIAEYLGVSERTVRRMIAAGEFPEPEKCDGVGKYSRRIYTESQLKSVLPVVLRRKKHAPSVYVSKNVDILKK